MQLRDKIAIVTGGGCGIGRGITERYLQEGARVIIAQRNSPDDALLTYPGAAWVQADFADPAAFATIVENALETFGGIDILVNNAGIMFERSLANMSVGEWDRMMAINLRAPVFLAQQVLPAMVRRGGGSIINIGSIEGKAANPDHVAYCASKGGVHGLTRALAVDLGRHGIRCNAIAPGWIRSDLSDAYIGTQADPAVALTALIGMHPIGRVGDPQDIGDLAVYLASDRAGFLTGQVIVVDGGRTSKLPLPF